MTLFLLTDFGRQDEFAGVLHAVLAAGAPGVDRVDLTHQIPAHDIRSGALTLWRVAPWVAGGVVLAVVDPGVGTGRRAVALRVSSSGSVPSDRVTHLVGPDNGLLLPAAHALGTIAAAVELPVPSPHTFAGRDTFAPAAAALAAGSGLETLGPGIDPSTLVGRAVPRPAIDGTTLTGEVLWVDTFGNAQLNATPADLSSSRGVEVSAAGTSRRLRIVGSYGAIAPDEYALVVDSYGLLSICRDRASAAAGLGLAEGDPVGLAPGTGPAGGPDPGT